MRSVGQGLFKQAQFKLFGQNAAYCVIDPGHTDIAGVDFAAQGILEGDIVMRHHHQIYPGINRRAHVAGIITRNLINCLPIRDDEAAKS